MSLPSQPVPEAGKGTAASKILGRREGHSEMEALSGGNASISREVRNKPQRNLRHHRARASPHGAVQGNPPPSSFLILQRQIRPCSLAIFIPPPPTGSQNQKPAKKQGWVESMWREEAMRKQSTDRCSPAPTKHIIFTKMGLETCIG